MLCSSSAKAAICSSLWITQMMTTFIKFYALLFLLFDQCRLGQIVAKTTSAVTNLALEGLHELRCNHPGQHREVKIEDSSSLSRWGWDLNIAIARNLSEHCDNQAVTVASGADAKHPSLVAPTKSVDHTGRNSANPRHAIHMPATSQLEIVRNGFKSRPLRDGGG